MNQSSIIIKIKEKYEELSNSKVYQEKLKEKMEVIDEFNSLFPRENIKMMTLEDYDFPKPMNEDKYRKSFMYFIERSQIGMKLSVQQNKLFYYDKEKSSDDDIQYNVKSTIKRLYPNLSIEQIFDSFKEEVYKFVTTFSVENYTNNWVFLRGQNVLKNQLVRFYYPKTTFGFVKDEIYEMMFKSLDIKMDYNLDVVEKSIQLKKEFEKVDSNFSKMNMEILTDAVYDVWTSINVTNAEKDIDNSFTSRNEILDEIYQENSLINDMVEVLEDKKNIILTGTPGVGKTHTTYEIIKLLELKQNKKVELTDLEERIKFTQFHQSYGYEEFVEGMTLDNNTLKQKIGIFKSLVDQAVDDRNNNYYIIIDEINRGNISKIFGELLMCIESDKRNPKYSVSLMYTDSATESSFYIPENVYIIGTMNTADRSLAPIDYALRRRFSFFHLEPAFHNLKFIKLLENCPIQYQILDTMSHINKILSKYFDSTNFDIGHSYYVSCIDDLDEKRFKRILKYDIIPLLLEYMSDLSINEIIKRFKSDNRNCKVLNELLMEMEKSNEN